MLSCELRLLRADLTFLCFATAQGRPVVCCVMHQVDTRATISDSSIADAADVSDMSDVRILRLVQSMIYR